MTYSISRKSVFVGGVVVLALSILYLLTPTDARAQMYTSGRTSEISLNPEYPAPGDTVRATMKQYTLDANQSLVTWRLNGEVVQRGYGELKYTFVAGEVGTLINLEVTMEHVDGGVLIDSFRTWVGDVSIVWEGHTYTPILYKGRALQAPGAEIALVALPDVVSSNGTSYSKDELTYRWTLHNRGFVQEGRGKHSVLVTNPDPYTALKITLTIEDPSGNVRARRVVAIPTTEPIVQLYEDSPLLGVRYDSALGPTYRMYSSESTVIAEPYHMSTLARDSEGLTYEWDIDRTTYDNPGSIVLRPEGDRAGSAVLNLSITNRGYWLQRAGTNSTIEFGRRPVWSTRSEETLAL